MSPHVLVISVLSSGLAMLAVAGPANRSSGFDEQGSFVVEGDIPAERATRRLPRNSATSGNLRNYLLLVRSIYGLASIWHDSTHRPHAPPRS